MTQHRDGRVYWLGAGVLGALLLGGLEVLIISSIEDPMTGYVAFWACTALNLALLAAIVVRAS